MNLFYFSFSNFREITQDFWIIFNKNELLDKFQPTSPNWRFIKTADIKLLIPMVIWVLIGFAGAYAFSTVMVLLLLLFNIKGYPDDSASLPSADPDLGVAK